MDDLAELFALDWPRAHEIRCSAQAAYVDEYVQWYFAERYTAQLGPLLDGFRSVVGSSRLLKALVDAVQLEQILCGTQAPVDMNAIKSGATEEDWTASDREYLDFFWETVCGLSESEQRQFVMFVSACSRSPPRGWQDFGLHVQRNGVGDDRLPTAFTCFTLLLLPRYSSAEVMKSRLLQA